MKCSIDTENAHERPANNSMITPAHMIGLRPNLKVSKLNFNQNYLRILKVKSFYLSDNCPITTTVTITPAIYADCVRDANSSRLHTIFHY